MHYVLIKVFVVADSSVMTKVIMNTIAAFVNMQWLRICMARYSC